MNQLNTKAVDTRPWAVCADVKSPARGGSWRGMLMPKVRTGRALAGSRSPPPPRKTPVLLLAWPLNAKPSAKTGGGRARRIRFRKGTESPPTLAGCWRWTTPPHLRTQKALTVVRACKSLKLWRPGPESNRPTGICSPLHSHSATRPLSPPPRRRARTYRPCRESGQGAGSSGRGVVFWSAPKYKSGRSTTV